MTDSQLLAKLKPAKNIPFVRPEPDWSYVHQERKRPGVTLQLLWEEYKAENPDGYQTAQFYRNYRRWRKVQRPSLRQVYKAGEKVFVDYAGDTVAVKDKETGKIIQAQIFVGTLGASNYTFARAYSSQELENWIAAHVSMYDFFGGVAQQTIPDNLRSAVSKACKYEPDINPTYNEMASHYKTIVLPARVRKPKDKAKVEKSVQVVERWILARLRNHEFFSIEDLNQEISRLLVDLNNRKFKKINATRTEWFEKYDKPALTPLPAEKYVFANWKKAIVNCDYHIDLDGHYYSVPYGLAGKQVSIRYNRNIVEILHNNTRIASHAYSPKEYYHTTTNEHMPQSHKEYVGLKPSDLVDRASKHGQATVELINRILSSRSHPVQGYRTCLGILRLGKDYGSDRLEHACIRAGRIGARSYRSVESILKNKLDLQEVEQIPAKNIQHENLRNREEFILQTEHKQEMCIC
jgi:transposase